MKLTYGKFLGSKEVGCLGRWCLLFGPEHHLKREALARFREQAKGGAGSDEPSWEALDGPSVKASDLIARCQTGALLGGARLVVVDRAERIDRDEQDRLAKRVGELPPTVSVVLVTAESGRRGRQKALRASLQQAIEKQGLSIEFPALRGGEAVAWAVQRARALGKALEPSAARKLAEQKVGTGLAALEQELGKLASFVGERKTITSADVEEATPRLIEEDIFRLVDAVATRNAGRGVTILRDMLRDRREPPGRILGMIAQAIREIWQTKLLLEHGWKPGDRADDEIKSLLPADERKNVLKVFARRQWQVPDRMRQANAFSWAKLARAMQALHDCDVTMKGIAGKVGDESMALELVVVQLCRDLEMPLWDSEETRART